MILESLSQPLHFFVYGILHRGWAAHDISVDISTGRQRAEICVVDPLDGFTQVLFGNPVQLQRLAGRAFEC